MCVGRKSSGPHARPSAAGSGGRLQPVRDARCACRGSRSLPSVDAVCQVRGLSFILCVCLFAAHSLRAEK
eukprot:6332731-Prymnesium_polylepis.1